MIMKCGKIKIESCIRNKRDYEEEKLKMNEEYKNIGKAAQRVAEIQAKLSVGNEVFLSNAVNMAKHIPKVGIQFDSDFYKAIERAGEIGLGVQKMAARVGVGMNKYLEQARRIAENIDGLPLRIKSSLLSLAEEGWFFGFNISISALSELKKYSNEGKVEEIEKFFVDYFESELDIIEEKLRSKFPDRKLIIEKAFKSHREGEYVLSIPVLLTQIDGICNDVTKQPYFAKGRDGKPRVAKYIEDQSNMSISSAFGVLLTENLPICKSEKQRGNNFNGLNRHMVLHGEAVDYGTKINSLKTISMISYMTSLFEMLELQSK